MYEVYINRTITPMEVKSPSIVKGSRVSVKKGIALAPQPLVL